MNDIEQSGFAEFDAWRALARRTRELLDAAVLERALPAGGADFIADTTLPHIEGIQNGFVGWLRVRCRGRRRAALPARASSRRSASSRRRRRRSVGRPRRSGPRGAVRRPGRERGTLRALRGAEPWNLAALGHARLVLAMLPAIPDADVRYPAGRRTYADIPRPRGPAELAGRLEELERQLWRTAAGPTAGPGRSGLPARLRLLRRRRPARWPRAGRRRLTIGMRSLRDRKRRRPPAQVGCEHGRWYHPRVPTRRVETGSPPTGRVAVARTA